MIPRMNRQCIALVLAFTLCQVIGTMCAVPDLSVPKETAILLEEGMTCPMDGTVMCPPSLISSPERQLKNSMVTDIDRAPILLSVAVARRSPSVPTPWSWSSVLSIVSVSIGSSPVLRI
jgi:hypothetical protein